MLLARSRRRYCGWLTLLTAAAAAAGVSSFLPMSKTTRRCSSSFRMSSSTVTPDSAEWRPSGDVNVAQAVDDDDDDNDDEYDLPWSSVQDWALADNLPKYTVSIALKHPITGKQVTRTFALWRTMSNEVFELAGYPPDALRRKASSSSASHLGVLPYLDEFAFSSSGGVSGKAYGVPGLAGGTRIETTQVNHVEITLPKGYVRTADGSSAYELGKAWKSDEERKKWSAEHQAGAAATAGAGYLLSNVVAKGGFVVTDDIAEDPNAMLARLGATTGFLLAGATAINVLSHHLTVNVFWV